MSVQYLVAKPGSILLKKNYNWFKRLWAKITKKELPYNYFIIFFEEIDVINRDRSKRLESALVEPKKQYSKRELRALKVLCDAEDGWKSIYNSFYNLDGLRVADLFCAINVVRPNTFEDGKRELNDFLSSKYYISKRLSDEKIWNEYIF